MATAQKVRVLFVCVGNACRSPMAEAIARQLAGDIMDPSSAGLYPLGRLAQATEEALFLKGYSTDGLFSKILRLEAMENADLVVNMSGNSIEDYFETRELVECAGLGQKIENWEIEDPYGENPATYQRILEELESRIELLAVRLRARERTVNP